MLVKKGANLDSKGMYGNTAIMKAGYWGKFDVLKYLLLMGANLEAQNDDGMTALILTAKDNKLECVKFLLERGANLKAKSSHGCTPLIASSENGHLEVVQLLVEKGRVTLDDQVIITYHSQPYLPLPTFLTSPNHHLWHHVISLHPYHFTPLLYEYI